MLLSFLWLALTGTAGAVDLQFESQWSDNPDRTFILASRSSFILGPTLEHKFKAKSHGTFFLLRSKLDYKHDTEAQRLREGEASTTLLAIKPFKSFLAGASFSAGHLWRWRRDYNVNSNDFQEIDGDHFFVDSRMFGEKKLGKHWVLELSLSGRLEDYASSYSIYVDQQNDNIGASVNSAVGYKGTDFEIQPSFSYNKKWWRDRRALSQEGFFVSPGEELKPDRIDTLVASVKGVIIVNKLSVGLTPSWSRVNDLNNDGRSWKGPGIGSELNFPVSRYSSKLKAEWSKRDYDTQVSSFQIAGKGRLKEETFSLMTALSGKLSEWLVEGAYGLQNSVSNQTDSQKRRIGMIKSSVTSISMKKTF